MEIELTYGAFERSSRFSRFRTLAESARLPPKQVFILTVQALDQGFGGMEHGVKYKTENLFEPEAWADMSDSLHRSVGICLSYFAHDELVPLIYASKPHANNKLYRLKPGVDPAGYVFKACS